MKKINAGFFRPSTIAAALMGLGALASVAGAQAAAPSPDLIKNGNRWTLTFHNDETPNHDQWATQGICFAYTGTVGTHIRYRWWSDTYPDWNGIASQEGDEVVMHGDYAKDVGHDAMKWDIVTSNPRTEGAGHWWEWRENGAYGNNVGFGNAKLARVGSCRISLESSHYIKLPLDQFGKELESPMGNLPVPRIDLPGEIEQPEVK